MTAKTPIDRELAMAWIKWLGPALGELAVEVVGLNALGAWRWAGDTRALMTDLETTRAAPTPARFDAREF